MARKTKKEAAETRQQIIDAARAVFAESGVSRTTLEQIATVAGVTRGAIYWHFANKTDLFFAMKDQAILPMLDHVDKTLIGRSAGDPLASIENTLLDILRAVEEDEATRQAFDIMILKCEYVSEFAEVLAQIMKPGNDFTRKLEGAYREAQTKELLRKGLDPSLLALDTYAFITGLLRLWFSDVEGDEVRTKARTLIKGHVASRRK